MDSEGGETDCLTNQFPRAIVGGVAEVTTGRQAVGLDKPQCLVLHSF
jgi:hypothetical protein